LPPAFNGVLGSIVPSFSGDDAGSSTVDVCTRR
jgi:hypothetical protein